MFIVGIFLGLEDVIEATGLAVYNCRFSYKRTSKPLNSPLISSLKTSLNNGIGQYKILNKFMHYFGGLIN